MGPRLYTTLKNKSPKDSLFDEILKTLKAHYLPKRNITYEIFLINKRSQKEGESMSDYAIRLHQLAASCKFEKFLDDSFTDRFLCRLRSSLIQSKLLA